MGVRNWRMVDASSWGSRLTVGLSAPLSEANGRIAEKVRNTPLLGLGASKNGRASAVADSSYWAAIAATSRFRGASTYLRRTTFLRNCSSSTRWTAAPYLPWVRSIAFGPSAQPDGRTVATAINREKCRRMSDAPGAAWLGGEPE